MNKVHESIEFYGENESGKFVIFIEEYPFEYETRWLFTLRSLEVPNPKNKIVPETLQETYYADEYKTDIPLRTQSYLTQLAEVSHLL